jgi:hypothetical protein
MHHGPNYSSPSTGGRQIKGIFVYSLLLLFYYFLRDKKLNDSKNKKLKVLFYKLLNFLFLEPTNF